MSALVKGCLTVAVLGLMATAGGLAQTQDIAPVNSGANPYHVIRDWAQLVMPEAAPVRVSCGSISKPVTLSAGQPFCQCRLRLGGEFRSLAVIPRGGRGLLRKWDHGISG